MRQVVVGVRGIPVLGLRVADLDRRGKRRQRQQRVAHFALLVLEREGVADLRLGQEVADRKASLELRDLQRVAQLPLVRGRAHADLRQHALGGGLVELAFDLERRLALVGADHRIVADAEAGLGGALPHERLAHVLLEQLVLQLRAHLRRDFAAGLLLVLRLALLPGLLHHAGRDFLAVDLDRVLGRAEGQVDDAVGAPEREHQDQQSQDHEGQPALAFEQITEVLQHSLWNGGADGTRTRDPRRDRPVF